MTRSIGLIVLLALFGCGLVPSNGSLAQGEARSKVKAAGCFIPTPQGVVLGISNVLNEISIPMGSHKPGETAKDTATRETLEETGLDVIVGPLLRTFENNTVFLFLCAPKAPIKDYSQLRPVDTLEIAEVIVLDPVTMLNHDGREIKNAWRFRENRHLLSELFEKYKNDRSRTK